MHTYKMTIMAVPPCLAACICIQIYLDRIHSSLNFKLLIHFAAYVIIECATYICSTRELKLVTIASIY